MKLCIIVAALLLAGAARADDKVDAAKTRTCEKSKKFMAGQKAKGKCAAESDAAAKLTCSPATAKQVSELFKKCVSTKPPAKPAEKTR